MLELIFQGFVEWLYGIVLEAWEHFASSLLDIMSMDFSYLEGHIAVLPTIRQALLAIGWALLLGNLIFQAAKSMLSGLGFEGENPKLLFARTFVFSFLLVASPQICDLCLNMTSKMIEILRMPTAVQIVLADERSFAGLAGAWLLVTICGIIVMFQSFKLILEMAERYFILAMLTVSAPLAFGMGGSKSTSEIFSGWCRMYGSMCLLMVLNVVFIKLLLSVLSYVPSGLDVLPWMVLVITIVKVAKKADAIITRIGLNPAMTGAPLGRSFPGTLTYIVARTAISNAARAIGNRNGRNVGAAGNRDGRSAVRENSDTSGNGGRTLQGAAGSSSATVRNVQAGKAKDTTTNNRSVHGESSPQQTSNQAASSQQTSYRTASSQHASNQAASQQSATQQESSHQNSSAQYGGLQSAVTEQQGSISEINGSRVLQGETTGGKVQQTRNTSVPVGTRRAPSHIKAPTGATGNRFKMTRPAQKAKSQVGSTVGAQPANKGTSQAPGTVADRSLVQTERDSRSMTVLPGKTIPSAVSGMAGRNLEHAHGEASTVNATDPSRIGPAGAEKAQNPATGKGGQSLPTLNSGMAGSKKTDTGRESAGKAVPFPASGSLVSGGSARPKSSEPGKTVSLRSAATESRNMRTSLTNTVEKAASMSVSGDAVGSAGNVPLGASESGRTSVNRSGTAGMASGPNVKAASDRSAVSVINGTAGNTAGRPLSGIHLSGAQEQLRNGDSAKAEMSSTGERSPSVGRPPDGQRSEGVGTQTIRQGPISSTIIAKEQNHITLNHAAMGDTSPGEVVFSASLSGNQAKERPAASGTRSTLRPAAEKTNQRSAVPETPTAAPIPVPAAAQTAAPLGKQTNTPQPGTAGSTPLKAADRGDKELRKVNAEDVPRTTSRQAPQPPKTVRQERKGTSVETRSIHREQLDSVRYGTAGNAAQAKPSVQVSAERPKAAEPSTRPGSIPAVSNQTDRKKAISTAKDVNQLLAGQTVRRTERKTRSSGGKKHG